MQRTKVRWVVAALFVLASRLVAAPPAANLVLNPDFAQGLAHWQTSFLNPNETKYARNHEWVSVVSAPDGKGKVAKFEFPGPVADSEGVKACSDLIAIDPTPGTSYEFGADVCSAGPSVILFIEGYQADPTQTVSGDNHFAGYVRVYRATLFVKAPKDSWSHELRQIKLPKEKRYCPSFISIKLYAFHPAGQVLFRHVFLRPVAGPPPPAKESPRQ